MEKKQTLIRPLWVFLSCQLNVAGGSTLLCEKRDDILIWTKRDAGSSSIQYA